MPPRMISADMVRIVTGSSTNPAILAECSENPALLKAEIVWNSASYRAEVNVEEGHHHKVRITVPASSMPSEIFSTAKAVCRIFEMLVWLKASSTRTRSEEHTSELQSLMRISYAGFCL